MAVSVVVKRTGQAAVGKFASIEGGKVSLFSGIMSDKQGGYRGCGRKQIFDAAAVKVTADDPRKEVRQR